jgi:hypothetical protein
LKPTKANAAATSLLDDDDNSNNNIRALLRQPSVAAQSGAAAIDFRSLQIIADELRRTSQLRLLIGRAVGEIESVAQVLVNSIWSFPEMQRLRDTFSCDSVLTSSRRKYTGYCGDKTHVVYTRPIRVAARDDARVSALRSQLGAMRLCAERPKFFSLFELAHAELKLAHAVDCVDVALLDDTRRIALLDCLFDLLNEGVLDDACVISLYWACQMVSAVPSQRAQSTLCTS